MDKKVLLLVAALLTAGWLFSLQVDSKDDYLEWKKQYGVQWNGEEDSYRRLIFTKNVAAIEMHNLDTTQTYKMGVNQFTGLTEEEFVSYYLNPLRASENRAIVEREETTTNKLGQDIDWTSKGIVTPIKNQGQCGSCWAFSAIAVVEAFYKQAKSQTVNLSEQQLVDCSKSYGNAGCNGGFNYKGLAFVKDHKATTTAKYPYHAKTETCKIQNGEYAISSVPTTKGCSGIASAIQNHVIGVSVDATKWSSYKSGIFSNCGHNLNHDVTLVGYKSTEYKIKNSWGTSYGENGYIRLAPGNTCGICDDKSPWVS